MKYCYFDSFIQGGGGSKYTVPVYCCDILYNQTPMDPNRVTIKAGQEGGYNNFAEMKLDVCKGMSFNPFDISDYFLNGPAIAAPHYWPDIIEAFGDHFDEKNTNFTYLFPEPNLTENIIGYNYFTNPSPYGTNAYYGSYSVGQNVKFALSALLTSSRTSQGITYDQCLYYMWIYPEQLISGGQYDFNKLFNSDDGTDKRLCMCIITFEKDPTTNKWNFTIDLAGEKMTQAVHDYCFNKLQGQDTGRVYDYFNPYDPTENPNNEGGRGGYDDEGDNIDEPDVPDVDVSELGAVQVYKLSQQALKDLLSYLHSHDPGDSVLKWWSNPIQGIVSLHVLPYDVHVKGASSIEVLGTPTGVSAPLVGQWEKLDLGTFTLKEYWGNALDYAPYTKVSLYLPMIGLRQINTDDVMNKTMSLKYIIDHISGAVCCFVKVGGSVLYSFSGNAAAPVPISQENWGPAFLGAATIAAGAIAGGVSAGAAAMAEGESVGGIAGNGIMGAVKGGIGNAGTSLAKPTISRSGSVAGASGTMSVRQPYVIIERPISAIPGNQQVVQGLPSGKGVTLGAISGFATIESCHLTGIPATGPELDEIERLLGQGAIF